MIMNLELYRGADKNWPAYTHTNAANTCITVQYYSAIQTYNHEFSWNMDTVYLI